MKINTSEMTTEYKNPSSQITVKNGEINVLNIDGNKASQDMIDYAIENADKIATINNQFEYAPIYFVENSKFDARNNAFKYLVENVTADWSKSPYSNSFYNSTDIDWNSKPENSLRVSDHWNFQTGDEMHCVTDDPTFKKGWAVGQYKNGTYEIIKKF